MALSFSRLFVASSLIAGLVVAVPLAVATPAVATSQQGDAASAPDEASARQIAIDFQHAVTVDSDTTETELIQAQPDGTLQLTEDSVPVRVQRGGEWRQTDATLSAVGGVLQPAAAAVPVQFSAGGDGAMAKVQSPSGQWLAETWPGGSLPTPSVAGDTATYPEVFPGVDLKLSATDAGMAQVLVIKDAQAAADPELKNVSIGVDNGTLTTTAGVGGATEKAPDGSTQLTAPVASWWDSSGAGASADAPGGNAVALPVTGTVTETQISLDAAAPAQKPGVTYPVYVDPDWTSTTNLDWATVDATFPNQPYWEGTAADAQHVGYIDAADTPPGDGRDHTARSYWRLDTTQVAGMHINSAAFHATMVHSYSCTPTAVQLWTTGQATTSTTWNSPGPRGLPLVNLSDTQSYGYGYNSSCPQHDAAWDATDAVQRVSDGGGTGLNLGLVASNESSPSGWKKFAPHASLVIDYGATPSVPNGRHITPCFSVCNAAYGLTSSQTPIFGATSQDSDSGVHLSYYFKSCAGTPNSVSTNCVNFHTAGAHVPGEPVNMPLPSGLTVPAGSNVYQAKACSTLATDLCSAVSGWFQYTVDVSAPNPPSATSTQVSFSTNSGTTVAQGSEGDTVSFTIHPPANANIADFVYSASNDSLGLLSSPSCPRASGVYRIVCYASAPTGQFVTSSVQQTGFLTLWSVDTAGNVSAPMKYWYSTNAPPPLYGVGHQWIMSPDMAGADTGSTFSLADLNKYTSANEPLTVSGTRTWNVNGNDYSADSSPVAGISADGYDPDMPSSHEAALVFDGSSTMGSTATGTTNAPVSIDSTHSFAMFAWVKPAALDAGQPYRVIASQATKYSSFVLEETPSGTWAFCMPHSTTTADPAPDCSTTSTQAIPGRWTMVEGVWDAQSGTAQVRIRNYAPGGYTASTSDGITPSEDATAVAHTAPTTEANADANAAILIGRAQSNSALVSPWVGDLADPYMFVAANGDPDHDNMTPSTTDTMWNNLPGLS